MVVGQLQTGFELECELAHVDVAGDLPVPLCVASELREPYGLSAFRTKKEVFGTERTVVVTSSQTFLAEQLVGLAQTRRRVETQLSELGRLLAAGRHKMDRDKLEARVKEALAPRWMSRLHPLKPESFRHFCSFSALTPIQ